ncbi:MAG: molecular chaperone [Burkholderiales bacterium]|nr:molecular chaperone [Burkholderiales bacterium]
MNLPSLARIAGLCLVATAVAGAVPPALGGEFSVTPISVDLKPGAMSETITVTNHAKDKLRVNIRLMQWTQDAQGKDVYTDSNDLVYFPRQMDVEGEAKRLVRVGLKTPAGTMERTYRLFIEEQPEATPDPARSQIAFYFRFGVPIFVAPAVPKPQPDVPVPTLQGGKLSIPVKNTGNQHFRLVKIAISDAAGYLEEISGWYSLAGTERTYTATLPPDVCRKAGTLDVSLVGEGFRLDRKVNVDPASCS